MEALHKQAVIAKLRGEPDCSEILEDIVIEQTVWVKEMELAKRKADNVILIDKDF